MQIVQGRQGSKQRGLGRWQRCIMRRLTRGAAARSAPHPTPRYPDPYSNQSPDTQAWYFYCSKLLYSWVKIKFEEKTGNGVFQDLWFRVLMPSLIFGQFAAKLENKIRFRPRSVRGADAGHGWAARPNIVHSFEFKEVALMPLRSDWHLSTSLAFDSCEKWTKSS